MARSYRRARRKYSVLDLIPAEFRRRAWTFVVRLYLTLAVATILCSCFVILRNYVAGLDCYQVATRTLVPRSLPSWAGQAVRRDLAVLPGLPKRFSIMEPGISERVARAFESNPWVAEVLSVRKVYPNRMVVQLRLRRPVAGVRVGGRFALVDASGHRLTAGIRRWPKGTEALPVIVAAEGLPPKVGEAWSSEGVRAGAAVAEALLAGRRELRTRFAAIDVTNVGGRRNRHKSDIVLVTHKGTQVSWGRQASDYSPGELTADEKISKMVMFEEKRGPLSGYRYVDIRFDDVLHGPRLRVASGEPGVR